MRNWITLAENGLDMTPYEGTGSLYHGTDLLTLHWIISSNALNQSIDQEHNLKRAGVSLTYDKRMAWSFAERSSEIFDSNHGFGDNPPLIGGIIGLDADRLRTKYRLVNYWDEPEDNEKEVRVLCRKIENLSEFLTMISFPIANIGWFEKRLRTDYGRA